MNALIEKKLIIWWGHCGLLIQHVDGVRETEIACSLVPAFWNNGYATEAARACKEQALIKDYTSSLISIISITNKPSISVALKNGMAPDKQTIYNNNEVVIYRIEKCDWRNKLG